MANNIGDLVLLNHVHEYHVQEGSGEDARMVRKTKILSTKAAIVTAVDDQGAVDVHVFAPTYSGLQVQDRVGDDSGYVVTPATTADETANRELLAELVRVNARVDQLEARPAEPDEL